MLSDITDRIERELRRQAHADGLLELRPGASSDSGIRILFAVEPPGTALLIAVLEGHDAVPHHYREAVVHDAGWATLVRLLEQKAERYGRAVVKVSRWFPSSQICSMCGVKDGPKPLGIRRWACDKCGTEHDRDVNAARNIRLEGRKVAAGLAETVNGCGAGVRPGPVPATGDETATLRGAA